MLSSLIDQIPWWIYAWGIALGVGALLYFFAPIIVPLWQRLPASVKWVIAIVTGVGLAFIAGRNKGHKNAVVEQEKKDAKAETTREEIHREVEALPTTELNKRYDRWVRPHK